ncbi:MAG: histidine phosphatase family protein [Chloroflexota bacterium]
MRLYIIRHGDPDYANDCLTETGQVEAAALGEYMATIGLDRLYCSPLGRARQTAAPIAAETGLEARVLEWTRELPYLPVVEDRLSYWDIHGHLIRHPEYLTDPRQWNVIAPFAAVPLDKMFHSVVEKSDEFLASLGYERQNGVYAVHQSNTWKVAVVCHGAFGLLWLAHLLAIPLPLMWAGFYLHPTSITTVLFDERTPGVATPRCIGLGETPHLHQKRIPLSRMGIHGNYW